MLGFNKTIFRDFAKISLPILLSGLMWGVSNALQTVILGHMDDSAIAAQSISSTIFLLLKVTAVGAASAASVIIGKTVGEGDTPKLREYTVTLQILFVGIGLLLGLVMFAIRVPLLSIYAPEISAATYALANAYMIIQSVVLACTGYQMPVNTGIIRGGGDTFFIMILDMGSLFVFIPLAMLGGLVWHWPTIAVIICVNVDQLLKCIPAFIRVNSYKWVHRLTRDAA